MAALRYSQENLEIDLMIGKIDACRIVHGVGIDAAAVQRILNACALGECEVGAFTYDLGSNLDSIDARAVVGAVSDDFIGLGTRFDISADATHPQQIENTPPPGETRPES
jgi:hypothetical protein